MHSAGRAVAMTADGQRIARGTAIIAITSKFKNQGEAGETMTTYAAEGKQVLPVQMDLDHGVLVATIRAKSLLYEMAINEIEECILASMPRAKSALLVDCGELTLHVSSQFLSMLVRVHRKANESGIKMGICRLSEALRMVYNVTALRAVLPAYETRQQAIADLGEFDIWEQRPIHEFDTEVARSQPKASRLPSRQSANVAAGWIVGFAAFVLIGCLLMTRRDDSTAPDPPAFRSAVGGQIGFIGDGTHSPDTTSMIVAWPVHAVPARKITTEQFRQAQTEGWIDIQAGASVGCVNAAGAFVLPTSSQAAEHTDYHLLVVSGHVRRAKPIPHHDQLLLSQCLADPEATVGDRDFTMGRIQLSPGSRSRFDWTFGP